MLGEAGGGQRQTARLLQPSDHSRKVQLQRRSVVSSFCKEEEEEAKRFLHGGRS